MEELRIAIGSAKNNSPGLDEVTAMLLRSLPDNMIVELLYIINELQYRICTHLMKNK